MSDSKEDLAIAQEVATLAWAVWRRTDFDQIDTHRSLEDEFASRIQAAADTNTVTSFLSRLAKKWDVRSVPDGDGEVLRIVHKYDDEDGPSASKFLHVARQHNVLIVLEMKAQFSEATNDSGTIQRQL